MNTMSEAIKHIGERFEDKGALADFRSHAWGRFQAWGLPAVKHEEWRYTRVSGLFRDDMIFPLRVNGVSASDLEPYLLPEHDEATSLVFVNGIYTPALSEVNHAATELVAVPLAEASNHPEYAEVVRASLGQSAPYHPDGIMALNSAFADHGLFIRVMNGKQLDRPVYIYHISDAREAFVLSQPRTLVHVGAAASVLVQLPVMAGSQ